MKKIFLSIVLFLMAFSIHATNVKNQIDTAVTSQMTVYNYQASYVSVCFYDINKNTTYGCETNYNRVYMTLDDLNNKSADAIYRFTMNCPSNNKLSNVYNLKFYEITDEGIYYTVVGLNDGYYGSFLFGVGGITFLLVTPENSFLVFYGI